MEINISNPRAAAIEAAAEHLAQARAEEVRAAEAVAAATRACDNIRQRIAALEAERASITARRAAGEHDAEDGARLALIAADIEGLRALLADAENQLAEVRQPAEQAHKAAAAASAMLADTEKAAAIELLIAHANHLDALLLETVQQLGELTGNSGRPAWGASQPLFTMLRRLAAGRGEL